MPRTLRDTKVALPPLQNGSLHGAQRPVLFIKSELSRLATKWASAFLAGQELPALQRAFVALHRHPEHNSPGYSVAKSALQQVTDELARRGQ
jgi:hypothetical protein